MSNAEIILRTTINYKNERAAKPLIVSDKKIRRAARTVNRSLANKKIDCALAMITRAVKRWERAAGKK